MKASNLRRAAVMVQQHMHRTFMELGHALSAPVLYFSLVLNAAEIFLGVPNRKDVGVGGIITPP
jgi:hypothetical protein